MVYGVSRVTQETPTQGINEELGMQQCASVGTDSAGGVMRSSTLTTPLPNDMAHTNNIAGLYFHFRDVFSTESTADISETTTNMMFNSGDNEQGINDKQCNTSRC